MYGSDWSGFRKAVTAIAAISVFCLLILTTWDISRINTNYTQEAEQSTKEYETSAEQRIKSTCPDTEIATFVECAAEIVESTKEAKRAYDDLAAQRKMALWASAMFWATCASVIFTGFGIWFIYLNLYETRIISGHAAQSNRHAARAALGAQESAEQARQANVIARENAIIEHRPWVDFDLIRFDYLYTTRRHLSPARIKIRNIGNSIAFDAQIRSIFYFDELPPTREQLLQTFAVDGDYIEYDGSPSGIGQEKRLFTFLPNRDDEYKNFVYFPEAFYEKANENIVALGNIYIAIIIRYTDHSRNCAFLTIKHYRVRPMKEGFVFVGEGKKIHSENLKIIAYPNRNIFE